MGIQNMSETARSAWMLAHRTPNCYLMVDDDAVRMEAIKQDPGGIAIWSFGYYDSKTADLVSVDIADDPKKGMAGGATVQKATKDNIKSGAYYLFRRYLYVIVNDKEWDRVMEYMQYGMGEEGQKAVEAAGYNPLPAEENKEQLEIMESFKKKPAGKAATAGTPGQKFGGILLLLLISLCCVDAEF